MVWISWLAFIRFLYMAILASMYMIFINCDNCGNTRFVKLTDCRDQAGSNFIIKTLNNVEDVECARICYVTNQCMLFFYNSMTRSCSFHNRTLTDIEMTQDDRSACYSDDNIAESWITEIINVSSSSSSNPASKMIGPSDGAPWLPSQPYHNDSIEVRFSTEMYIEQIHIYEIYKAGSVRETSLLTPEGTWFSVWSTDQLEDLEVGSEGRILSPDIQMTDFKTSTVRIDFGPSLPYDHIDAVRVVGNKKRNRVQVP